MPETTNEPGKISIEDFRALGKLCGTIWAMFQDGFQEGYSRESAALEKEKCAVEDENEYEAPEKCQKCWCYDCANYEDCVIEADGYAPGSKPCPCDSCITTGKAYMPKDKPPCKKYKPFEIHGNVKF